MSPQLERLLADVAARPAVARTSYNHPGDQATVPGPVPGAKGSERDYAPPLGPAEGAWVQQLPADPEQVSFQDAVALASMAARVDRRKNPGDARLIDQAWKPVKETHDWSAATVALDNAKAPLPQVPNSALPAVAEAISAENDQLLPEEAHQRASEAINEAAAKRSRDRDQAIANAETAMLAVASATLDRTAVTA